MNISKKLIILSLIVTIVASLLCACGGDDGFVGKKVSGSSLQVGDTMTAHGIGELVFKKAYMSQKICATMMSGTYIRNNSEENTYIDMVFRFKNKGMNIPCGEVGYITAEGVSSGEVYDNWVNAVEDATHKNLHANVMISSGDTVTLHMAVSVPQNGADDKYKVKLHLRASSYELEYLVGDYISDAKEIFDNQSLSNSKLKLNLNDVSYKSEIYDIAPMAQDCPEGMVYICSKLEVTNKTAEDKDISDVVCVRTAYQNEIFISEYYVQKDGLYEPGGVVEATESAKAIAVMCVPEELCHQDIPVTVCIDHDEFFYTVFGGEHIAKRLETEKEMELAKQKAQAEARRAAEELRKQEEERKMQEQRKQEEQQALPDQTANSDTSSIDDLPQMPEAEGE